MMRRAHDRHGTTGRYLAVYSKVPTAAVERALQRAKIKLLRLEGHGEEKLDVRRLPPNSAVIFDPFKVVLVNADEETINKTEVFETVEEEQFVALPTPPNGEIVDATCTGQYDHSVVAWGVQVTRAVAANNLGITGKGCRVCVIDSGLNLVHPDFAPGPELSESFIGGTVQDERGHGTHCAGIICGNRSVPGPRYSVAPDAKLLVARVFKDTELAPEALIIAAIRWAVLNHAHVISISIHRPVAVGEPFSAALEEVANTALACGTLIISIAGNHSFRGGSAPFVKPLSHPANCPSIMAVAALGTCLNVASMSNGSINIGQSVDIAAPGVLIDSAYTTSPYRTSSGTSTAAPFVAGIAALHFQKTGKTGAALWQEICGRFHDLKLPPGDVGVGMALAPKP
jgi:subtilisin